MNTSYDDSPMAKVMWWLLGLAVFIGMAALRLYRPVEEAIRASNRLQKVEANAKAIADKGESEIRELEKLTAELQQLTTNRTREAIVGHWEEVKNPGHSIRFFRDGRLTAVISGIRIGPTTSGERYRVTSGGRYRVIDDETIEFSLESMTVRWKYVLNGDSLEMKAPTGEWEKYRRRY